MSQQGNVLTKTNENEHREYLSVGSSKHMSKTALWERYVELNNLKLLIYLIQSEFNTREERKRMGCFRKRPVE